MVWFFVWKILIFRHIEIDKETQFSILCKSCASIRSLYIIHCVVFQVVLRGESQQQIVLVKVSI